MNCFVCRLDDGGGIRTFVLPEKLAEILKEISGLLVEQDDEGCFRRTNGETEVVLNVWPFSQGEWPEGEVNVCLRRAIGRGPSEEKMAIAWPEAVTDFTRAVAALVGGENKLSRGFGGNDFYFGFESPRFWIQVQGMPYPNLN